MSVAIFWKPAGFELDQIGAKRLVGIHDGDTPSIRLAIRMLSIDTAETSPLAVSGVKGLTKAAIDQVFADLCDWLKGPGRPVPRGLRDHLIPRLEGRAAGTTHLQQGAAAKAAFEALADRHLKRPTGSIRPLFVRVADTPFDRYGRLLAYVAPEYSAAERAAMTRAERATFNFRLVQEGWAASFIVFPSIPGELDLPMFRDAARQAIEDRLGAWADPLALTGYEFRMLCRLAGVMQGKAAPGWIDRYCACLETARLYAPADYVKVAPWNRLFIYPADVRRAVAELNLRPG